MMRTSAVVIGVLIYHINPALHLLASLRCVWNFLPKHERIGQFPHHGVLHFFGKCPSSYRQIDPGHGFLLTSRHAPRSRSIHSRMYCAQCTIFTLFVLHSPKNRTTSTSTSVTSFRSKTSWSPFSWSCFFNSPMCSD